MRSNAEDAARHFNDDVDHFYAIYDSKLRIFTEAIRNWIPMDYARGEGRLAREEAKQGEESLTTKTEFEAEADETALE